MNHPSPPRSDWRPAHTDPPGWRRVWRWWRWRIPAVALGLLDVWLLAQCFLFLSDRITPFEAVAHASAETKESLMRASLQRSLDKRFGGLAGLLGITADDFIQEPVNTQPPTPIEAPEAREDAEGLWGFHALVATAEDPLSTFSVDVDTGSWTLTRAALSAGRLPDPDRVRVEEFVNALPYDYAAPTGDAPFAAHFALATHPFKEGRHVMRVGLQARGVGPEGRPPVNLVFLVDVSGSMQSADKLPLLQESLKRLLARLGPEDRVALVTYASRTEIALLPTSDPERARAAIDALGAGGSTAMGSGIELAYQLAAAMRAPGRESRVIIASDGDANVGAVGHEGLGDYVARWAGQGITLTTLGFGSGNYQDETMEQLANRGDGAYYYIDQIEAADELFGRKLDGSLVTVARDVKLQVAFDPAAVEAWRLIGYENRDIADAHFRVDAVDAGEVGAGHQVTALYELVLREESVAAPLCRLSLRAKPPGLDAPAREWQFEAPSGAPPDFDQADPDLRAAFAMASFAEQLHGNPAAGLSSLTELAQWTEGALREGRAADAALLNAVQSAERLSLLAGR